MLEIDMNLNNFDNTITLKVDHDCITIKSYKLQNDVVLHFIHEKEEDAYYLSSDPNKEIGRLY